MSFLSNYMQRRRLRKIFATAALARKKFTQIEYNTDQKLEWKSFPNRVWLNKQFEINQGHPLAFPDYFLIKDEKSGEILIYGNPDYRNRYSLGKITTGNDTFNQAILMQMYDVHIKFNKQTAIDTAYYIQKNSQNLFKISSK